MGENTEEGFDRRRIESFLGRPEVGQRMRAVASVAHVGVDEVSPRSQLRQLKAFLPRVKSAYRPSGALSFNGALVMVLAVILSIPVTAAVGAVAWCLGLLLAQVVALLGLLMWRLIGAMSDGIQILIGIACLLAVILRFVGIGWAAAFTVSRAGKLVKNRNVLVGSVFSSLAALMAAGLLVFLLPVVAPQPKIKLITDLTQRREYKKGSDWDSLRGTDRFFKVFLCWGVEKKWYPIINGVGTLVAAGVALVLARRKVAADKFCERCGVYMQESIMCQPNWAGAALLSCAYESGDLTNLHIAMGRSGRGPCSTSLFFCPTCDRCYVETTAHYEWVCDEEGSKDRVKGNWLIGSMALTRDQARTLPGGGAL